MHTNESLPEFVALQEELAGWYSLEREIGRGGMGIVYLARDVTLDRPVALKLLLPEFAGAPALRERFLREARTAARLSHPNIVPIHAVEEVADFVFFAMAYVDGETLEKRIAERGPLEPRQAARVLCEIAWALAYAHAQGVVHRDIKPDNVLLERESDRVLVTDFGIAHLHGSGLTGQGEVLGTAEFMSPEQASGEPVDARSDLYALGAVGYYAVSGRLPVTGPTVQAVLAKHMTVAPQPLREVAPDVPGKLARAIERCLTKAPADRPASGEELAEALVGVFEVQRETPVPLRVFVRKNKEKLHWELGVLLALLVTALGIPWVTAGGYGGPAGWLAVVAAAGALLAGTPLGVLALRTRRLLRAGFTLDDIRFAVGQDHQRRSEELRFEHGTEPSLRERVAKWTGIVGLGLAASGTGLLLAFPGLLSPGTEGFLLLVLGTGAAGGAVAAARAHRRRDPVGHRWVRFWNGTIGRWVVRLAGKGLKRDVFAAGSTHRPTELAIGVAADHLYERLPEALRRQLPELPATVRRLEDDARQMRQRIEELNAILDEVGDRDRGATEHRERLVQDVRETRDAARQRLADAVAAIETLRLGLLRMHAGAGDVAGITEDLAQALEVSDEIGHLLAGQREVEELLGRAGPSREPDQS